MWKWKTVCQAAARQALIRLMPSASRTSFMWRARRCAARTVAERSSASISSRPAECRRGTTSACPGVAGAMSMKATVRSSESIVWLGTEPSTMPQKRQSAIRGGAYRRVRAACRGAASAASRLEQFAGTVESLSPVADLAGEGGRAELLEHPPHLGSRRQAEFRGEVVARQGRARRPLAMPDERVAEHRAGEVEVRLDHLRAGQWPLPPGGEAIGDAEQRDVGGDGVGGGEVVVDRAPRQRPPVDQEAEAQMVLGEPLQVGAEAPAHLEAAADARDDPCPGLVVPDEGDVGTGIRAGLRLAEIVEERPEAQGAGTCEVICERLREELLDLRREVAREAGQIGLEAQPLLQHRESVAEYVEVVIGVLDHAAERRELREDDRRKPQLVHQLDSTQRIRAGDDPAELRELPLAGRVGGMARLRSRELGGRFVDGERVPRRDPRRPQQPKRVA